MSNPDIRLMRRILERLLLTIYMEAESYETKKIAQFHEFKDALYYAHIMANCKGLDRQR